MKTLHLLRHAKSSWKQQVADRERGLNERGKRDARRMGVALAARMRPMSIQVSPARRARLTLRGLCEGWPALRDLEHTTREAYYTFDCEELLAAIARQEGNPDAVFMIGHNPAMTELVNLLVAEETLDNLPTAGYVELALRIDDWRDLRRGCASLAFSLFPKQLADV